MRPTLARYLIVIAYERAVTLPTLLVAVTA
jgi:hypothetical protein